MGYKYNKEDILKVGYDILRKNGYHHVGINQILKESWLPKGSFYNFFESKEDFAYQVITYYGESNLKWLEEFFAQKKSPYQLVKSFYKVMIDENEADAYASGCLISNMSNEIGMLNDRLAEVSNEYFLRWVGVIAQAIEKGQEAGEITTQYHAMELAEYLHAGFYGTFSRMKVTRSREFMDQWYRMTMDFIST